MNANKLVKPKIIIPPKVMAALLIVAALIMIGIGAYIGFFESRGFENTTATIVRIDAEDDIAAEDKTYITTVTYTVDGKEYTEILDSYAPDYKVGKEVKIKYNPANPAIIHADSPGFAIYLLGAGVLLLIISIFVLIKNSNQRKEVQEGKTETSAESGLLFKPSSQTEQEREVYFLTDLGTAKGTCHIEDRNSNVLYEAACDKFSLLGDSLYTFVNHENGSETAYSIGKTDTTSSNGFLVLDNHSTFTLDGRDIWKQLHKNGIRIETGMDGLKWVYTIYQNETKIARVVSANKKVHEEEEDGVLSKVPMQGFFRIWTRELSLDAVFMTVFAIGRTDMMLYD